MRHTFSSVLALLACAAGACADAPSRQAGAVPGAPSDSTAPVLAVAAPAEPPTPARVAKPEQVKALYLNAWAAGSPRKIAKLIDIADKTEINSFVIDVKEAGEISSTS